MTPMEASRRKVLDLASSRSSCVHREQLASAEAGKGKVFDDVGPLFDEAFVVVAAALDALMVLVMIPDLTKAPRPKSLPTRMSRASCSENR